MYQNPNQPMQNPYMDRLTQLQQYQQTMSPTQMSGANAFTTLGKMVENVEIVKATDIPMDGNMYYFPKADGTEIYGKQWLNNGQTRILTFKPLLDDNPNENMQNVNNEKFDTIGVVLEGIQSDIKSLNDKIDELNKTKTTTRARKEE